MERIRVILIIGALLAVSCRDGGEFAPADCWDDNSNPGYDLPGRTDEGSTEPDNGRPVCEPQCDGKSCGPDGCGWSCGNCVEGTWCSSGTCVPFGCVPQCTGKVCGADGCGGYCGSCSYGLTCNTAGQCVEIVSPSSEGTGDCVDGIDNDADGLTDCDDPGCFDAEACESVCVPSCSGKVCGDNGCGGSCGFCGTGLTCNASGRCVVSPSSEGTGDCVDGIDNDADGLTDCDDPGCFDAEACQEVETTYTVTCQFSGYVINMTDPTVKLACPRIWTFTESELDTYGRLPLFARNTGTADGALETTTKSLYMKDQVWPLNADPSPSAIFAMVNGEAAGICDPQYPLQYKVIVPARKGQAVTANCGAN